MRILLARHGETVWNVAGRRQGWLDSPLTERGHHNVQQLLSILEREALDLVCSSPLGRASATAAPIARRHGLETTVVDELAELDMGAFSGLSDEEIDQRFPGALSERAQNKYSWRFPGGESYADLDARSARALRAIERRQPRVVLIVSHSMITRMLLRNLLGWDPDEALAFNLAHGVIVEVTSDSKARVRTA